MDLNICLFCEKPLDNDKLTFCSGTCQLNEATKNNNINYNYHSHNHHHNYNHYNNSMMIRSHSVQSISSIPSSSPSNYEMSYHRRQSFSYSPVIRRRFSNSISSSSYDSLSSSALSFDSKYFLDQS